MNDSKFNGKQRGNNASEELYKTSCTNEDGIKKKKQFIRAKAHIISLNEQYQWYSSKF